MKADLPALVSLAMFALSGSLLANLLPEEEQLAVLTRSLGLDRNDTLAVLSAIGGDTAGALSFGVASNRPDWRYTRLTDMYGVEDPSAALARHIDDLGRRPFLVGEEGVRQSLAGGQKKSALAVLDPLRAVGAQDQRQRGGALA